MTTVSGKTLKSTKELYREMLTSLMAQEDHELLFAHHGEFSHDKMEPILTVIENSILETGNKRRVMKRICNVLIESLQNIAKHGAIQGDQTTGFVILSKSDDGFHALTGNLIHTEDAPEIEKKIKQINKLNSNELRKMYIETLCNENFTNKGGAGLGFLTIAKKSKRPLDFSIEPAGAQFSHFMLDLIIEE